MQENNISHINPIIWADYPDPDVIRVEDTYYMVSTTMHFMPGGVILRSYDLVNWEVVTHIYEILDDTPAQRLEGAQCIYGKGMWAASLRYHKEKFYVCFVANDTQKTYLYQAEDICGPWTKSIVDGFYHDCSLLFDDDNRVYIVYGNTDIYLTELKEDLSGPKPDGLHRMIITEKNKVCLGYEGSHFYKINGKYYVFLIHWLADGTNRRVEACFMAESLESEFTGRNILDDDMAFHNDGVAQGGIVDTPFGDWYAMLFQDHGAIGRIPVLVPMHWENDFPVLGVNGKVPRWLEIKSTRPDYAYEPMFGSDDFIYHPDDNGNIHLKSFWQWNHTPDHNLWTVTEKTGNLRLRSGKISKNLGQSVNTLTQRMMGPACAAYITVDGKSLNNGDYAGICALQGCYGLIGLAKEENQYYLVMMAKENTSQSGKMGDIDEEPGKVYEKIPCNSSIVTLKLYCNFDDKIDEAEFYYLDGEEWKCLGIKHKLYFTLDHFVGCRFGLFMFSTEIIGGIADFMQFKYELYEN